LNSSVTHVKVAASYLDCVVLIISSLLATSLLHPIEEAHPVHARCEIGYDGRRIETAVITCPNDQVDAESLQTVAEAALSEVPLEIDGGRYPRDYLDFDYSETVGWTLGRYIIEMDPRRMYRFSHDSTDGSMRCLVEGTAHPDGRVTDVITWCAVSPTPSWTPEWSRDDPDQRTGFADKAVESFERYQFNPSQEESTVHGCISNQRIPRPFRGAPC